MTEIKYEDVRLQAIAEEDLGDNLEFIAIKLSNVFEADKATIKDEISGMGDYEASRVVLGAVPIKIYGEEVYVRPPLPD